MTVETTKAPTKVATKVQPTVVVTQQPLANQGSPANPVNQDFQDKAVAAVAAAVARATPSSSPMTARPSAR